MVLYEKGKERCIKNGVEFKVTCDNRRFKWTSRISYGGNHMLCCKREMYLYHLTDKCSLGG